jgi:predicted ATP-dependent serine protease
MQEYFCNDCGAVFEAFEKDPSCGECGSWDTYENTPEGAAASRRSTTEYENAVEYGREED